MVPAAIGTETDGSITCPAAINGIVGFKPTVGLVSRTHVVPISHSQDTAGPMTRTVRDAALVLSAIAGSDPADPATAEADAYRARLRRRPRRRFAARQTDRRDALRQRLRHRPGRSRRRCRSFRAQGATLVEINEFKSRGEMGQNEFNVLLTELKADLNAYLATTPPRVRTRTLADVIAFNKAHADTRAGPVRPGDVRAGGEDQGARRSRLQEGAGDQPSARRGRGHRPDAQGPRRRSPWSGRPCRRPGRSTRSTATRFRAAAAAASPRSPAIRTSPCRWGRSRGCRWA